MLVQAHTHVEMEVVKWLALVVLAGAIALLVASTARGRENTRPPETSSSGTVPIMNRSGTPMPTIPPVLEPRTMAPPTIEIPAGPAEDTFRLASEIWNAIEFQKEERIDEAVEAWTRLRLPAETDVWRLVALGHAHLQLAEYEKAAEVLSEAKYAAPENAVVHYVIGMLWLAKAETALEWHDAPGVDTSRLAAWQPMDIAPNSKSMYGLAAVMCFERAVTLARQVNLDEPLLTIAGPTTDEFTTDEFTTDELTTQGLTDWMVPGSGELAMPVVVPTVRNLLSAFDADSFEGRSHYALGVLHTERDVLDHAERHLDRAAALNQPTGAAFRDLGEKLEQREKYGDAMRMFLKSFSHGGGITTVGQALENAGKALLR